jgi:hypothetical protein
MSIVAWFVGAMMYSVANGLIIWLVEKLLSFHVSFKGEIALLATLVVLEPFLVSYTIDKNFTFDWSHFISYNLPQFVLAVLILRWINRGKE